MCSIMTEWSFPLFCEPSFNAVLKFFISGALCKSIGMPIKKINSLQHPHPNLEKKKISYM